MFYAGGCQSGKTKLGTPVRRVACADHGRGHWESSTNEIGTCRRRGPQALGAGKCLR